ncbi:MAG: DUF721 domain-containing protein [Pseudomonadota bacterium]
MPVHQGTTNGFKRSGTLLSQRIRKATETRGFAVSRVLTHWAEIVGEDIATIARPVEISYGRQGFGAILTVLTTGAQAPMLEMQKEALREKVNAAYGYSAVSRIRITQTAATGFAEGQAVFAPKPALSDAPVDDVTRKQASQMAQDVDDEGLRDALEALAQNFLKKRD